MANEKLIDTAGLKYYHENKILSGFTLDSGKSIVVKWSGTSISPTPGQYYTNNGSFCVIDGNTSNPTNKASYISVAGLTVVQDSSSAATKYTGYRNGTITYQVDGTHSYTLTLPQATGTLALTSDIPSAVTSVNGLSGGTLTSPITFTGGDGASASKIIMSRTGAGQITDDNTSTIFGWTSANATTLTVGSNSYSINLRGSRTRPQYKGSDLALYSDLPTESTVSGWGFTKNAGTVTSVNNTSPDANGNVSLTIPSAVTSVNGLTGGTISSEVTVSGNINGQYIKGTWLYTSAATDNSSWTDVFVNSSGWLYKRSKSGFKSDLGVQDKLVSGTNIKTINNSSILGSGNLTVTASETVGKVTICATETNVAVTGGSAYLFLPYGQTGTFANSASGQSYTFYGPALYVGGYLYYSNSTTRNFDKTQWISSLTPLYRFKGIIIKIV